MKTSKEYYEEALKELGATDDVGVPMQAATEIALIKALKDFLDEFQESMPPFSFDSEGNLLVKERNY
jgi:hypothetical protein